MFLFFLSRALSFLPRPRPPLFSLSLSASSSCDRLSRISSLQNSTRKIDLNKIDQVADESRVLSDVAELRPDRRRRRSGRRRLRAVFPDLSRLLAHVSSLLAHVSSLLSDVAGLLPDVAGILSDVAGLRSGAAAAARRRSRRRRRGRLGAVLADESRLLSDVAGLQPDLSRLQPDVAGIQPDLSRLQSHESCLQPHEPCLFARRRRRGVREKRERRWRERGEMFFRSFSSSFLSCSCSCLFYSWCCVYSCSRRRCQIASQVLKSKKKLEDVTLDHAHVSIYEKKNKIPGLAEREEEHFFYVSFISYF